MRGRVGKESWRLRTSSGFRGRLISEHGVREDACRRIVISFDERRRCVVVTEREDERICFLLTDETKIRECKEGGLSEGVWDSSVFDREGDTRTTAHVWDGPGSGVRICRRAETEGVAQSEVLPSPIPQVVAYKDRGPYCRPWVCDSLSSLWET